MERKFIKNKKRDRVKRRFKGKRIKRGKKKGTEFF